MNDNATTPEVRAERLAVINAVLVKLGLSQLLRLGDHTKGEIEFVEIIEVIDRSKRFFTDIVFSCVFYGGATGEYTVRWNAHSAIAPPAVMVVLIDGKFALTTEYRPAHSKWMPEFPRGFSEAIDKLQLQGNLGMTVRIGDLPLNTVSRELGEEVLEGAEITTITALSGVAQDSSTQAVVVAYYLVNIVLDEAGKARLAERLKNMSDEGLRLRLWTFDQVAAAIGGRIADAHTIVAYALYLKYIEGLPGRK